MPQLWVTLTSDKFDHANSLWQVVLIPIGLGAFLNWSLPKLMARLSPFAPLLASAMTVLVSASIVAQNAAAVRVAGPRLILAVASLHTGARHFPHFPSEVSCAVVAFA